MTRCTRCPIPSDRDRRNEKSSFQLLGKAKIRSRHNHHSRRTAVRTFISSSLYVRHRYLRVFRGRDFDDRDADTVDHCRWSFGARINHAENNRASTSPLCHCVRPPIRRGTYRRSRSDPRTRESKLARNRPPWSYSVVVTRSSFPSIRFDRLPKKRGEGRKKEKEKEGKKMLLSCFSLLSALGYRHSLGRVYPLPLFNQNAVVFQLEGIRRVQAIT